jgi:periplasmic divalent cation tolerance protein
MNRGITARRRATTITTAIGTTRARAGDSRFQISMTAMPAEAIQVVTTTAEKKDAEAIVAAVLEKRLAACVQLSGPIDSSYWWNGRLETAREWVVTIKTRRDLYVKLEKLLLATHPYDQPEIIATPIVEISPGYLKWLNEQVKA